MRTVGSDVKELPAATIAADSVHVVSGSIRRSQTLIGMAFQAKKSNARAAVGVTWWSPAGSAGRRRDAAAPPACQSAEGG